MPNLSNLPDCGAKTILAQTDPFAAAKAFAVITDDECADEGYLYFTFNDHSILGFCHGRVFHIQVVYDWDMAEEKWVQPMMDDSYSIDENNQFTFHKASPPTTQ